jgi:hypothetical protein
METIARPIERTRLRS